MFRSSPPEVFSKKDAAEIRSKSQENNRTEACSQQSRFATLLKSHSCTDAPPRIQSTPAEHLPPGEHLSETAPVCQKGFKKYKL